MRKSFDGLAALAESMIRSQPSTRQLFIFSNRRRTIIKILGWDTDGFAIWMKKLSAGTFRFPNAGTESILVDRTMLMQILDGIDVIDSRKRKRYSG